MNLGGGGRTRGIFGEWGNGTWSDNLFCLLPSRTKNMLLAEHPQGTMWKTLGFFRLTAKMLLGKLCSKIYFGKNVLNDILQYLPRPWVTISSHALQKSSWWMLCSANFIMRTGQFGSESLYVEIIRRAWQAYRCIAGGIQNLTDSKHFGRLWTNKTDSL